MSVCDGMRAPERLSLHWGVEEVEEVVELGIRRIGGRGGRFREGPGRGVVEGNKQFVFWVLAGVE